MAGSEPGSGLRWAVAWAIFVKEVRETLRDRRTLFLLIAIPMLFYPLMLLLVTEVALSQKQEIEARVGTLAVQGELPAGLRERLQGDERLELITATVDASPLDQGQAQAVLVLPPELASLEQSQETAWSKLRYNSVEPLSKEVRDRVVVHLEAWRQDILQRRLDKRGLQHSLIKPLDIEQEDIAPRERQLGSLLSQFLPMLVLVFMVTGAFYPAIDLTAGEKERKTIQTLLTSPVRPLEVVLGKYLTVFLIALLSGVINILSIALIMGQNLVMSGATADLGISVSGWDVAALLWVVLLLGAMFSALMMTIATLAESPKDAQSYLSPVYMLCLLPVLISQLPGMEMSPRTAFVPVLNLSLAIKEILINGADLETLFLVSASTLATTALILALAARLYQREELLIERSGARGLFLGRSRRGEGKRTPDPEMAIMLMAVLFVLLYYVGSALQSWNLMAGLVLTLAVGMLGPVLLAIKLLKLDLKETLHLRRPPALAMAAALLLGVSSFVWVSALTHLFYETFLPVPEVFEELLREAFTAPEGWADKLLMVAVVAVTPAICEEAIFRGWLLSSLRGRVKPWVAVGLTAVIFGVFHLSIYRFLGTASLGLLMGWMVWQTRSIWPAVLYHLLNNACSVLSEDALKALGVNTEAEPLPIWLLALSLAMSVAGGLLLLRSQPAELEDQAHHGGGVV